MEYEILSNVFLKEKYVMMELVVPRTLKDVRPGQFLHVRIEDSSDPLLRRPLSIHDVTENPKKQKVILRLLYDVVGKGTELLSQKKPFSVLDGLGPLGNGFDVVRLAAFKKIYIVAGGMGVAPLFFLAKRLCEASGAKGEGRKIVVLIGAKTKNHIICEKDFKNLGCDVEIATDDGSKGFKGKVTELLKDVLLKLKDPRESVICSCGPKPMQVAVSEVARHHKIPAYVSMEEFMGCGLGACLGCVIRTTSGYKRICHDGPVFEANEIIWKG